ncbi:hypothetical protein QR680_006358 [Steinernema hermaphroditum]|uniref:G-protein coupled receptors family 1 profile domain-containing protein n=1 Tax=Steinernema hermaphroditum TaxID=289476 RepID=A0AA39LWE8_9BILA|nr:hypothetical protein QR680_006358 [Steinernema hermaphroditum]
MNEFQIGGTVLLSLATFGLFGNVNIVVATLRKKHLRSKSGILICLLAVYDFVCLSFEMASGARMISGVLLNRQTCFKINIAYFCIQMISASTVIGLALDRLMAVSFPIWYIKHHLIYTVLISTVPGALFSTAFTILGLISMDEENATRPACTTGNLLPRWIQKYANWTLVSMNSLVVVVYISAYIVLYLMRRRALQNTELRVSLKSQERAMKSITAFLAVFIGSWFLSKAEQTFLVPLDDSQSIVLHVIKATVLIPVMVSYSQCYYILFWRSTEYREAFIEQLKCQLNVKLKRSRQKSSITAF